jgi:hypothetical protein
MSNYPDFGECNMLDRDIEDTRQPDESRYNGIFECEFCGCELSEDDVMEIPWRSGYRKTAQSCHDCAIRLHNQQMEEDGESDIDISDIDDVELEDATDEGQVRDALDLVREFAESQE